MKESKPLPDSQIKNKSVKPIVGFYGFWVILTYFGVISATAGIFAAMNGNIELAVICLMLSGIFDMFDGPVAMLAKRTDREKSFGIQIDALADLISFGALPTVIGYAIYSNHAVDDRSYHGVVIVMVMSAYILAGLIRLAYFNVTEAELQSKDEKRKYYEGLPVTSAALIIPLVYSICVYFDLLLSPVYNTMLVLISLAFVIKVKIPKIKLRFMIGFCLVGLLIMIYIFLSKRVLIW